jgi:nitrite reductase/ring-hydroxylating ferredoxin subunit
VCLYLNSKIRFLSLRRFCSSRHQQGFSTGRVDLDRLKRVIPQFTELLLNKMDGYHCVGIISSFKDGLQEAKVEGIPYPIVLIKRGNVINALNGECPHKKGEMALGDIEDEGNGKCAIICPRHRKRFIGGLRFDTTTGEGHVKDEPGQSLEFNPNWRLQVHNVVVKDEKVFIKLEPNDFKQSKHTHKCDAQ